MAFYNNPYQPNYQQGFPATYQPVQQMPMQQAQPQIQNGGFISVRSEQKAMNYPVAPGNSVTFKDEGQPYVYVKTMGFNQMEPPAFKKYRLVEEENLNTMQNVAEKQPAQWAKQKDLDELKSQFALLRSAFDVFTDKEEQHE